MNIIEVELELEDDRFCNSCKCALRYNRHDDWWEPEYCFLEMDWSIAIAFQDYEGNIKDEDILSPLEFKERKKYDNRIRLGRTHSDGGEWYEHFLRPQECIDRARKG